VIAPAFTFPATTNVVEIAGAVTRLADIDLRTFCMDPAAMEARITGRTRAVIVVHEFGQSADLAPILAAARRRGLLVIEDAACALGTEYRGSKAGSLGDVGCFSFHPRKAVTTGEGGMLVTAVASAASRAKSLRNHGLSLDTVPPLFVSAGLNYRMTNMQGAIGAVQMQRLDRCIRRRRGSAALYSQLLAGVPGLVLPEEMEYGKHVYQTYHVLVPEGVDRDALIKRLRERGIETNIGAYAVHEQPYYSARYRLSPAEFPNASAAYHRGLALPLYDGLSRRQVRAVADAVRTAVRELS
jgi:dTDP-4-amino-4,6-dideoxygalactose transaminase